MKRENLNSRNLGQAVRNQRLAVAHERIFHDAGGQQLAANIDFDAVARRHRHTREADGFLHGRRERAAGELAVARRSGDALMTAQHAALVENQTDELALHARRTLRIERGATHEITLRRIERNRPRQAGFERRQVFIHVVAVQIHARFEAQRVARTETALRDAGRLQIGPELRQPRRPATSLPSRLRRCNRCAR